MKKNNLFLILFVFLTLINLASALSYGGSLSLGDLLNQIEPSTMILGIIFGVSFILISISLTRVFKENKTAAGALSLLVSLGIVWGINLTGMDYTGFFQNIFFFQPCKLFKVNYQVYVAAFVLLCPKPHTPPANNRSIGFF